MASHNYSVKVPVWNRSYVYCTNGNKFYLTNYYDLVSAYHADSQVGTEILDYKAQIAKRLFPFGNYSRKDYVDFDRAAGSGNGTWNFENPQTTCVNSLYKLLVFDDSQVQTIPSDSSLDAYALQKLKNKLASETKSFAGLVPIGELKEMSGLVKGMASLTKGLIPTLLGLKGKKDAAKYAADAWLTYSFGVSPLVATAKDVGESLASYTVGVDRTLRQVATSGTKTWKSSQKLDNIAGPYGGKWFGQYDFYHKLSYLYGAISDFKVQSGNAYGAIDFFGLGPQILPLVGWELFPYSWIVDYFANVGDFLEDIFLSKYYSTRLVWKNVKYEAKATGVLYPVSTSGASHSVVAPSVDTWKFYSFTRTKLSSLPRTPLVWKYQDQVASHAVNKLLNLASLLVKK